MTFLVDTNILLYAANRACVEHSRKFLRVSTHRRVLPRPLSAGNALRFLVPFLRRDEVAILVPTARHWQVLQSIVAGLSHPAGNLFHDIETAVLMREHGVREIITADTDFLQFQFLKVTNPVLRVA